MNRNFLFVIFTVLVLGLGVFLGCTPQKKSFVSKFEIQSTDFATTEEVSYQNEESNGGNGVLAHGALTAMNGKIVDKNGKNVVLKGMSSHGIVWFPQFTNKHSIEQTKLKGANVFRVAMYTEEYGGYTTGENEKQNSKKILYDAIENVISLDMYVIVDWHILNDFNPQKHKAEALAFFDEISKKYANNPAVIFEICNEPHNVSWKNDIKPYAEEVIGQIRKNSPNSLIIVGTNTWSQDVDEAAEDMLAFSNIAYAFHFYAGTHKLENFKPKIEKALAKGATVFVSEWGTTQADGNNGNYFDEAKKWLDYFDEKEISRVNWSLCDKNESSAAVLSGSDSESWNFENLTQSGKFVFENFK